MKFPLVCFIAIGLVSSLTSCTCSNSTANQDNRLGGRAGVAVTSQDMSHVAPTRRDVAPAN
jgi:hypothetical protein